MNARLFRLSLVAAAFCAATVNVAAHHSRAAEYDTKKPVEFTNGVVTMVEWTNPHIWTHVEVKQPDGTVVTYRVEAGAPNPTFRRGWRKESLKPGTVVSFKGIGARNPASLNLNGDLKLPDGTIVWEGVPAGGAPPEP